MRASILHESKGRLRVHLSIGTMSVPQADIFEAYLRDHIFVKDAQPVEYGDPIVVVE